MTWAPVDPPGDWPAGFVADALPRVAASFAGRPDMTACRLAPDGWPDSFLVGLAGEDPRACSVRGAPGHVLAWLTGRGRRHRAAGHRGGRRAGAAAVAVAHTHRTLTPKETLVAYTGKVTVGGPADTRELPGLTITKVSVGPMDNNAYLLRCTQTGELALIDAANDAGTLLGLIGDSPLATIITTHQHWDHHAALKPVQQATGAVTVAHPAGRAGPADPRYPPGTARRQGRRRQRRAVGDPPARPHARQHRAGV